MYIEIINSFLRRSVLNKGRNKEGYDKSEKKEICSKKEMWTHRTVAQKTQVDVQTMLFICWSTVCDVGSPLKQQCLLVDLLPDSR